MLVKTQAIVLSTTKYGESDLIARLYTREVGTQSFMLKGVRKSRKGKLRVSLFQPLTQLRLQFNHKNKGQLEYIKEAQLDIFYETVYSHIVKSSIVMFFSEVLSQILKEQQPDPDVYDYLSVAFQYLDQSSELSNFSIKVLVDLTSFLGFAPDMEQSHLPYFDMVNGGFDNDGLQPHHTTDHEASLLKLFIGTKFENVQKIKMNRDQRSRLLHTVIDYFQIHLHAFKKPTSLSFLKQIFD
ncbi:MAG: DNA repair protein RecO [Nonlabens sp.]